MSSSVWIVVSYSASGRCFEGSTVRRGASLYRRRRVVNLDCGTAVEHEGRRYVNFSSNDYLGLRTHPDVISAAARAVAEHGAGSAASALITGYSSLHASAEAALARWKGTEAAVLLPSGYPANPAVVQTIAVCRAMSSRFAGLKNWGPISRPNRIATSAIPASTPAS
jgi:7-keto-8-aminopelargonate synthetase-like enzyme